MIVYYVVREDGNTIPLADRIHEIVEDPARLAELLHLIVSESLGQRVLIDHQLVGSVLSPKEHLKKATL